MSTSKASQSRTDVFGVHVSAKSPLRCSCSLLTPQSVNGKSFQAGYSDIVSPDGDRRCFSFSRPLAVFAEVVRRKFLDFLVDLITPFTASLVPVFAVWYEEPSLHAWNPITASTIARTCRRGDRKEGREERRDRGKQGSGRAWH